MKNFFKLIISFFIIVVLFLIFIKYFGIDKIILKRVYPKTYLEYVQTASEKYGVKENLIFAIIKNESNFKNSISSHKGAQGLMQLMETTAIEVAQKNGISSVDLSNPKINIEIGTCYYKFLFDKYNDEGLALAAYNAGSGNVDKWIQSGKLKSDGSDIENIPYKETNMYVRKVLQTVKMYEYIYEN